MTISGIGTNSYYAGQMSAMWSRGGMAGGMGAGGAMEAPPDPSEVFDTVDIDGSGGLSETEFQSLADKISEATGEEVDAEELFATYDADGDGILSEEETQTAMEANRPQGPPPGGMGMMGGMGGMQGPPPPDSSEIFSDADEDGDDYLDESEAETLAEMISQATDEEMDVEELLEAYDEDGDGLLSEDEAAAALEANRPEAPPSGGMMAQGQGGMSTLSAGIASYMQMASLGMEQNQFSSMFSVFGGNSASSSFGGLFV